jgi:predicted transposase/invertase (TIGR01784 family)
MANDHPWLEPVGVSPRVDCVFKAILGDPARTSVLLDFLAAVLGPEIAIASVELRNPVHLPDFLGDDSRSVDVEARDRDGRTYQIEMQTWNEAALKERMLYTWADLYGTQLGKGQNYKDLRPVIAIWVLDQNTLRSAPGFHHRFALHDATAGVRLTDHLEIHTLELDKWRAERGSGSPAVERWMAFFAEAENWVEVPAEIKVPPLEEAMSVLKEFKTNAQWNDVYRSRLDWIRRDGAQKQAVEEANAEKDRAVAAKDEALARQERLREQLRQAGIEPLE